MKTIKLSNEKAIELYKTASPEFKAILEEVFGKTVLLNKITDKVNTWRDVVDNTLNTILLPYQVPLNKIEKSINAYAKLQHISKVLNEGWEPDFSDRNQQKWYPWFEKTASGWVFNRSLYHFYYTELGSGLYFKSKELADHAAKYFLDIYKDYLPE